MLATKISKRKIQFLHVVLMTEETNSFVRMESKNVKISQVIEKTLERLL